MSFEERIEALTARHEALAQTVELNGHQINDLITAISKDAENIRALTARHEGLAQTVELNGHQITDLIIAINKDGENIRSLARIAEAHERRIEHLEDDPN